MSNQGEDGWYPECEECGAGNCGKMVCLDCYNKLKETIKTAKDMDDWAKEQAEKAKKWY